MSKVDTIAKRSDVCLITACDDKYAPYALNLLGSLGKQSKKFSEIIIIDLGISSYFRFAFEDIDNVKIVPVQEFCPHYKACWSWKPWAYMQSSENTTIYIDAGSQIVGNLDEMILQTKKDGYFLVSQKDSLADGHYLEDIIPKDYYDKFDISKFPNKSKPVVAAGILGFTRQSGFYQNIIKNTYQSIIRGDNLGWSEKELRRRNRDIHYMENPVVRDCRYFRHDQTILNIYLYKEINNPKINDMSKYAALTYQPGTEQVILNQRRHSKCRRIFFVKYSNARLAHIGRILRIYLKWRFA